MFRVAFTPTTTLAWKGFFLLLLVVLVTPAAGTAENCETIVLDFNDFQRGDYLDLVPHPSAPLGQYNVVPIPLEYKIKTLECEGGNHGCRIFDTANPTHANTVGFPHNTCDGDSDLGSPNYKCTPAGPGIGNGGVSTTSSGDCVPRRRSPFTHQCYGSDRNHGVRARIAILSAIV
jgi:hypothetical protein